MKTKLLPASEESINLACELLRNGEIVGVPTETVYGLAGDARDKEAIKKIFEAKGRPSDNPLIVHISNMNMLKNLVSHISEDAQMLANAFWPGPLTIIMPKSNFVCDEVTAGLNSIGIRMPANKTALEIIEKSKIPFAAPSANLSGKPSPTTAQAVYDDMNGKIPLIIDNGECDTGVESTVISILNDVPTILRPGIITKEDIEKVLNKKVLIAKAITEDIDTNSKILSPGMKYKHYSPNAEVIILKGSLEKFINFIKTNNESNCFAMCFDGEESQIPVPTISYGAKEDAKSQAHNLFKVLRNLDKQNAKKVYVRCPNSTGISLAVYNRLIRSAGFKIINL